MLVSCNGFVGSRWTPICLFSDTGYIRPQIVVTDLTREVNILALQFTQFAESFSVVVYILVGAEVNGQKTSNVFCFRRDIKVEHYCPSAMLFLSEGSVCSCSYFCILYPLPIYIVFHLVSRY